VEFITGSRVSLKIGDPRIVDYIAKNKNADLFYDLDRSDNFEALLEDTHI
jgi:hypothetical protein